jgi:hypothetical protein
VQRPPAQEDTGRLSVCPRHLSAALASISFLITARRWPHQEIRRFDPKNARQPVHHVDAGSVAASFERADIGSVDFRAMRQFFLRQAPRSPKFSQIERQDLPYLHDREGSALKSISPRSILYKDASAIVNLFRRCRVVFDVA